MNKAHLFFPENDLALGRNLENYTAPIAAQQLRTSGELLPIWFMDAGDCVVARHADRVWLEERRRLFGFEARIFDGDAEDLMAAPWGWSRASRRAFERIGFDRCALPSDDRLEAIRQLSHRRTASHIAQELASPYTPVAQECRTAEDVKAYMDAVGSGVVKLPWSSTGRGVVMLEAGEFDRYRKQIGGMISNQGSVMCEPRLKCVQDLAMLFTISGGEVRYDGLSVFRNAASGSYEGNILAPQSELEQMCAELLGDDSLARVRRALIPILEKTIGTIYEGPLGVDMMIYDHADGHRALDGCVELNLRNTMGHLALQFYHRYCHPTLRGMLRVATQRPEESVDIEAWRMAGGTMCLNPRGGAFSVVVESE